MSAPRFFIDSPLAAGSSIELPGAVAHHALRVLRLGDGDAVTLFDGRGGEYPARLRVDGKHAGARIGNFIPIERESPLAVTLLQSLVAAEKTDWIVEKAVELGAARIVVAPTARSAVKLAAGRAAHRLKHWREVAIAACCQCGRNRLPAVELASSFDAALATVVEPLRLILAVGASPAGTCLAAERAVAIAVGPEGGFTDAELADAQRAGFVRLALGPRILRTETAGLAALAALQALRGDWSIDLR